MNFIIFCNLISSWMDVIEVAWFDLFVLSNSYTYAFVRIDTLKLVVIMNKIRWRTNIVMTKDNTNLVFLGLNLISMPRLSSTVLQLFAAILIDVSSTQSQ